jgi:hypothetical protein
MEQFSALGTAVGVRLHSGIAFRRLSQVEQLLDVQFKRFAIEFRAYGQSAVVITIEAIAVEGS